MTSRRWMMAGIAALALSAPVAQAQIPSRTMYVVIKFNDDKRAWDLAQRFARATAMPLVGVSPSTNSAVFTVPNEVTAGRNQQLLMEQFPSTIWSYNYGLNYPRPADLESSPPVGSNDQRRGGGVVRGRPQRQVPVMLTPQSRQAAKDWFVSAQRSGSQLRIGQVLDTAARTQGAPPTTELLRMLPTIPGDHRYLLLGSNLVIVDGAFTVVDFVNLMQ